ncbi:MAG: glycoside hydrolase family 5 protein [Opitutaceae bacterium]|jgi:hypothetical protein
MSNTTSFLRRALCRTALGAILLALAPALRAQNTDATDTAPGVGEPAAAPARATATPATPAAPAGPSLLANGDFSAATQDPLWPDGWPHDPSQPITWEKEGSIRFLRLVSQKEGQLVQLTRTLPLSPDVKGLVLTVRFRIANFKFGTNGSGAPSFTKDIHFSYKFLDAQGQPVAKGGGFVLDSHAKDWTDVSRRFLVPEGAAAIQLIPVIAQVKSGTLDLGQVIVTPMPAAEAGALAQAPLLAAKKQTEDEADILKLLELPSKTPEIKVSGNRLVTAAGATVWLQGVNVPSLEWSAKGEYILRSVKVAIDDWKANVIRLPVNDGFWFGRGKAPQTSNDPEAYRLVVDNAIKLAAARGAYIVLDLHRFHAPEDGAVEFWKDAAARYKNNPAVLFDLFNEPTGIPWAVWQKGGDFQVKQKGKTELLTKHSTGMQALIDAVRSTGAKNIVVAGGLGYAYDLSGVLNGFALTDSSGNGIMYATHFYNWHGGWQKRFLDVAAKYPILVGEFGADVKKMGFIPAKNQEDPYTWSPDALALVQKYRLNYTAFCIHPKATPRLIENWNYDPTPFWGQFVKDALAGKKFELKKMR